MKKNLIFGLILTLASVFGVENTFALEIQNLKIVPTSSELSIQWDLLSDSETFGTEGYALQWGLSQGDVKIDKHPKQLVSNSKNYLSIRAADFEKNTKYYFRVYTYTKDNGSRGYNLSNGSKILEWEWNSSEEVTTNYIEPNDPIISTTSDSTVFDFGQLRVVPFDKSVQLSWSRANLASHEYTGTIITLSENLDLSDPVYELKAGKSNFKGFIKGLDPAKKYYAGGYFYKKESGNDKKFGKGTVVPFTTAKTFTTSQQQSYNRTIARLKQNGLGAIGTIGNSTTTSSPSTSSSVDLSKKSSIENKIKELEIEIKAKQKELSSLKERLRSLFGTTTSSRKSTKRTSLRERLLKKLNR